MALSKRTLLLLAVSSCMVILACCQDAAAATTAAAASTTAEVSAEPAKYHDKKDKYDDKKDKYEDKKDKYESKHDKVSAQGTFCHLTTAQERSRPGSQQRMLSYKPCQRNGVRFAAKQADPPPTALGVPPHDSSMSSSSCSTLRCSTQLHILLSR